MTKWRLYLKSLPVGIGGYLPFTMGVTMYNSTELKFKVTEVFDKNSEYNLWIISFFIALQDLATAYRYLFDSDNRHKVYFFKISVGHLREAFNLIRECLKDDKGRSIIENNKKAMDLYQEVLKLCNGDSKDSFAYKVLVASRNKVFHYGKDDKTGFEDYKRVLSDYEKENFWSSIKLAKDRINSDYLFAEEFQLNLIVKYGEDYNLTVEELMTKLSELTAKILLILECVIGDFLSRVSKNKYYLLCTK